MKKKKKKKKKLIQLIVTKIILNVCKNNCPKPNCRVVLKTVFTEFTLVHFIGKT